MLFDDTQRFDAVPGLADDLDAPELLQEKAQFLPRQLLIVHDDGPEVVFVHVQAVIRAGASSSGMTIRAQVPSPGTLSSWSW